MRKQLLRIGILSLQALGQRQLTLWVPSVERGHPQPCGAASPHECRIDYDAGQPCRKLGAPLETPHIAVCRKKPVLQSIFGVFRISQNTPGCPKQLLLVPAEQRLDCLLISTPARPNECLFRCRFGSTASASHFLPPKFCVDGQDGLCHVDSGCDLSFSNTASHCCHD